MNSKYKIIFLEKSKTFSLRNMEKDISIWKNYKFYSFKESQKEAEMFLEYVSQKYEVERMEDEKFLKTFLNVYAETFNENEIELDFDELEEIKEDIYEKDVFEFKQHIEYLNLPNFNVSSISSNRPYCFNSYLEWEIWEKFSFIENKDFDLFFDKSFRKSFKWFSFEEIEENLKNFFENQNIIFSLENWNSFDIFRWTWFFDWLNKNNFKIKISKKNFHIVREYFFGLNFNLKNLKKHITSLWKEYFLKTDNDYENFKKLLKKIFHTQNKINGTLANKNIKNVLKIFWIEEFTKMKFQENYWNLKTKEIKENKELLEKFNSEILDLLKPEYKYFENNETNYIVKMEDFLNSLNNLSEKHFDREKISVLNYFRKNWKTVFEEMQDFIKWKDYWIEKCFKNSSNYFKNNNKTNVSIELSQDWKNIIFNTSSNLIVKEFANKIVDLVYKQKANRWKIYEFLLDYKLAFDWDFVKFNFFLNKIKTMLEFYVYSPTSIENFEENLLFKKTNLAQSFIIKWFLDNFDTSTIPENEFEIFKFSKETWLSVDFLKYLKELPF